MFDPKPGVVVASLAYDYPAGHQISEHAHGSDQLIYATGGVMRISAGTALWTIPPQFAIWLPARMSHRIHMPHAVSMRTLYLRPRFAAAMAPGCMMLHVTPLLRELILEAVRIGSLRRGEATERALAEVLRAALAAASPVPISLTLPQDRRAAVVAEAALADLAGRPRLETLCRRAGAGVRTIERLFRRETGADFETWRRQARLVRAVELLLAGRGVAETAYAIGYQQPSAFIAAFRRLFGATPRAWTAALSRSV